MSDDEASSPNFPGGQAGLRALRLMARKSNTAGVSISVSDDGFLLWPSEENTGTPLARIDADVWALWKTRGWLAQPDESAPIWSLTDRARQKLRAALKNAATKASVSAPQSNEPAAPAKQQRPEFNPMESPIGWLARRGMITAEQLAAGDRLRADFTIAGFHARVTTNYDMAVSSGSGAHSNAAVNISDAAIAASARVRHAMRAVGPELASILMDVCCLLHGLEQVESKAGWPLRSGKVVLQIALTRLARHYGLLPSERSSENTRPVKVRHWGAADYRPEIGPTSE